MYGMTSPTKFFEASDAVGGEMTADYPEVLSNRRRSACGNRALGPSGLPWSDERIAGARETKIYKEARHRRSRRVGILSGGGHHRRR